MKQAFSSVAFQWPVVRRSLLIAAVVGTVLIAIDHGSCLLHGQLSITCAVQSSLTLLVPYCVSTVSCVLACTDRQNETQRR